MALTVYQQFLIARWQRLNALCPVTPWERRLLEHARFSIWLEARRQGLTERELARGVQAQDEASHG
jgi:hypothetical protein